jgi:membrane protein DedA with SNARE-associated domain
VFVFGGLITGLRAVELGGMATVVGATALFALAVVAAIGAGLGALGGYAGGRVAESQAGDS